MFMQQSCSKQSKCTHVHHGIGKKKRTRIKYEFLYVNSNPLQHFIFFSTFNRRVNLVGVCVWVGGTKGDGDSTQNCLHTHRWLDSVQLLLEKVRSFFHYRCSAQFSVLHLPALCSWSPWCLPFTHPRVSCMVDCQFVWSLLCTSIELAFTRRKASLLKHVVKILSCLSYYFMAVKYSWP